MRMIVVHPTDPGADARSCTQALQAARAGDVVLLNPGTYSPARTGEVLPLRIPPGVAVAGAGQEASIIDGEGLFERAFNPLRPDRAGVRLDDGATLRGRTVPHGRAHGIRGAASVRNSLAGVDGGGRLFACSFGPPPNRLRLTVADNVLRADKQFGLGSMTAVPVADNVPQESEVTVVVAGHNICASPLCVSV